MTIVIQHAETRQFLIGLDEWVIDPRGALTFTDTRKAMNYCRRHELNEVRLLAFFRDKKLSLLLYVPGSKTPTPTGSLHTTGV